LDKASKPVLELKTPNAVQTLARRLAQNLSRLSGFSRFKTVRSTSSVPSKPRKLLNHLKKLNKLFIITVIVPTALAILYFGLIASDVYVSESHFLIRSSEHQSASPFGMLLKSTGFTSSQDDAYTVQDYLLSRDALQQLNQKLDVKKIFEDRDIDIFSRFPGLSWDDSFEAFFLYYRNKIELYFDPLSSIMTLRVRGFSSEDSFKINQELLNMGERLVNELNKRSREDTISFAVSEVALAESKAKEAALALSSYRNLEEVINPESQSALHLQYVTKLQGELLATQAQLAQIQTFAKNNPQIPSLELHIQNLQKEMNRSSGVVTGGEKSLASKAATYQRLALDSEFAHKQLVQAQAFLEQARTEAQRKQLYLEPIVQPSKPDQALEPRRIREVCSILIL
jgi:capsular polysaccharide transport system permease protein